MLKKSTFINCFQLTPDDLRDRPAKYKHNSVPLDRKYGEQVIPWKSTSLVYNSWVHRITVLMCLVNKDDAGAR
jgi:hypothetical protein